MISDYGLICWPTEATLKLWLKLRIMKFTENSYLQQVVEALLELNASSIRWFNPEYERSSSSEKPLRSWFLEFSTAAHVYRPLEVLINFVLKVRDNWEDHIWHNTFAPLRWRPRPRRSWPRSASGPSPPRGFGLLIRQFLESGAPESRTFKH